MSELERRLVELGHELDYPLSPAAARLAAVARERAPLAGRRRAIRLPAGRRPRAVAVALGLLLAAIGLALAVPGSRAAILDWLGVRGVRIERVPELPEPGPPAVPAPLPAPEGRTSPGASLDLGERVSLERAQELAGAPVRLPQALGRPDAVYIADLGGHPLVTLVYAARPGLPESEQTGVGLLLTQIRVEPDVVVAKKLAASATAIVEVGVGGRPGIWIEGAPHLVVPIAEGVPPSEGRLAGNTLLWDEGGVTYRLEADLALEPALEIARSLG